MRTLALALCLTAPITACGGRAGVPERVHGVIVDVRPAAGAVREFAVETDFDTFVLRIDPARDYGFDLRHLDEHRATGDPVVVRVEARNGVAYALAIDDA